MNKWLVAAFCAVCPICYGEGADRAQLLKYGSASPSSCSSLTDVPGVEIPTAVGASMTICEALQIAEKYNPDLTAQTHVVESRRGRAEQAKVWTNPVLGADHDQWAKQTTLQISQQIETGDKRQSRIDAANADIHAAGAELRAKHSEVFADIKRKFVEAILLQEEYALNERRRTLAQTILYTATKRVEAGRSMKIETIRAELALADTQINADRISDQMKTAQAALFAAIGIPNAPVKPLRGSIYAMSVDPRGFGSIDLNKGPDQTRAAAEVGRREAEVKIEEVKGYVDFTVSGGARYFGNEKKTGIVVGVAVPVPIFNRNTGAIHEAKAELDAAKAAYLGTKTRIVSSFSASIQEAASAYREAKAVREVLLPGAKKALAAATEAFQRGKLDYLNVLDAQRSYFESEERQLQALATYHKALADAERYAGESLDSLQGDASKNSESEPK